MRRSAADDELESREEEAAAVLRGMLFCFVPLKLRLMEEYFMTRDVFGRNAELMREGCFSRRAAPCVRSLCVLLSAD